MADVRIGGAYVDWQARNAQFLSAARRNGDALRRQEAAVRRLRRTVRDFNRTATDTVRRFTSLRGAVVSLAGAGGFGLLIRRNVAAADELIKTSRAVGLTTDAYQELAFAADISGVNQEKLNSALTAFAKRVGEARVETGTMTTILRRMDEQLFANIQASRNTEEAFNLIINAAIGMSNELDRTALLAAAFGRTVGPQMANFLLEGEEGIRRLRQQARDLGLIIDRDQLMSAEALNDRFTEIGRTLQTRVTVAILDNADAIEQMASSVVDLVPQVAALADGLARGFSYVVDNAATILAVFGAIRGATAGAAAGGLIGSIIPGAGTAAGAAIGAGLGATVAGVTGAFISDATQASTSAAELRRRIDELTESLEALGSRRVRASHERRRQLQREIEAARDALAVFATVPGGPTTAAGAPQGTPGSELLSADFGSPFALINTQLVNSVGHLTRLRGVAQEVTPQIELTTERLDEWPRAVERTSLAMDSVLRLSAGIGVSVGSFVSDLAAGVNSLADSVRNLAREITALLRTELIARPIAEGIQGFLLNQPGFLGLGGIGRAQVGGLHRGLTLVGEQGPELVNLGQSSRVTPAGETAGLLGGDTINLDVSVVGADADFVEQVVEARVVPRLFAAIAAANSERSRG